MGDYCSYQELYISPHETSKDALHFGDGKCVEVRLSLLEHHFFTKLSRSLLHSKKNYYLTHALLSGIHF